MKLFRITAVVVLCCLMYAGTASAGYNSSQDLTLSVNVLPGILQTSDSTGTATFNLQESLHSTITSTTGESLDHSYTWVYVNGEPVLAVDPLCVYDWD